jgi:hypothetical protein
MKLTFKNDELDSEDTNLAPNDRRRRESWWVKI